MKIDVLMWMVEWYLDVDQGILVLDLLMWINRLKKLRS